MRSECSVNNPAEGNVDADVDSRTTNGSSATVTVGLADETDDCCLFSDNPLSKYYIVT